MHSKIYEVGHAIVYDDHKMFASTFSMLLERTGFFSTVSYFSEEKKILNFFASNSDKALYLFADFILPNGNLFLLIADVRRFCPTVRIVIVSSITNAVQINKILRQKVNGFISKSGEADEVLACIQTILSKHVYISPYIRELIEKASEQELISSFTSREIEILTHIGHGHSTSRIAQMLNITNNTVLTHRKNMLAKTKFASITELLAHALKMGLIYVD